MRASSPIQARSIPVKKADVSGFLSFGPGNVYPQMLVDVTSNSVTAGACLAVRSEFIEGNGFKDKNLWPLVVHRSGITMDHVLNYLAQTVSFAEVICLHVGYNGLGRIASIKPVSFEIVRYAEPDDNNNIVQAGIFPYLGSSLKKDKKNEHTKLNLFNPDPRVVQEQIIEAGGIENYKGQLIYEPFWNIGDEYYHKPSWLTAIREIETEGVLSDYDFNTVSSGFHASGMLTILDNTERQPGWDPYNDESTVEYQIESNMGKNSGGVIVNRVKTIEQFNAAKFEALTGTELSKRYESTSGRIEQHIARAFQVPAELAQVRRSGNALFQSALEQQMAYSLMQKKVNRYQRGIERIFTRIFEHWKEPVSVTDFSIENLSFDTVSTDTATQIQ